MKITDLLTKATINLDVLATSKETILNELAEKLDQAGKLSNLEQYKQALWSREKESTTGIGEGIAIPHAKTSAVKIPAVAFGRSKQGIEYQSLDGQPAHLFFMIAANEGDNNAHLEALSKLSTFLLDRGFREKLMSAESADEIIDLFSKKEQEVDENENQSSEFSEGSTRKKLVAVTGCPTGIAHTYMAADSLKAKAKELGYEIKVQTNGSTGVKNRLTAEDIEEAEGVIVAADTKVDMEPFEGYRVVEVPVTDGIRRPEELINQIINKQAPIYKGGSASYQDKIKESKNERKSKQSGFYRHLMNGVSHMLPFVVGGGILIAISFFFGIHSADPHSPQYNKFAEALMTIGGGNAFGLMIPVLAGYIAYSIGDRPGLAPGMVGGLLASSGHAGFLGGLIAGFLAGYLIVLFKYLFRGLPQSLEGLKPILIFPLLGVFFTGIIMIFVVNTPVMDLNNALTSWLKGMGTTNAVVLGLILGGMMAVDMGGPVNKAAYTFGLAMLSNGSYLPQAAIMAGGMVPPLGMALGTTFFKNKFTESELSAGKTCYILGVSFITEGAIPFAAADPGRVIPSSIIGSAIAGGLSMLFHIGLRAPHGGIFVIPLVTGGAWLYALAILIGAAVTALLVGFWKKPVS